MRAGTGARGRGGAAAAGGDRRVAAGGRHLKVGPKQTLPYLPPPPSAPPLPAVQRPDRRNHQGSAHDARGTATAAGHRRRAPAKTTAPEPHYRHRTPPRERQAEVLIVLQTLASTVGVNEWTSEPTPPPSATARVKVRPAKDLGPGPRSWVWTGRNPTASLHGRVPACRPLKPPRRLLPRGVDYAHPRAGQAPRCSLCIASDAPWLPPCRARWRN